MKKLIINEYKLENIRIHNEKKAGYTLRRYVLRNIDRVNCKKMFCAIRRMIFHIKYIFKLLLFILNIYSVRLKVQS